MKGDAEPTDPYAPIRPPYSLDPAGGILRTTTRPSVNDFNFHLRVLV